MAGDGLALELGRGHLRRDAPRWLLMAVSVAGCVLAARSDAEAAMFGRGMALSSRNFSQASFSRVSMRGVSGGTTRQGGLRAVSGKRLFSNGLSDQRIRAGRRISQGGGKLNRAASNTPKYPGTSKPPKPPRGEGGHSPPRHPRPPYRPPVIVGVPPLGPGPLVPPLITNLGPSGPSGPSTPLGRPPSGGFSALPPLTAPAIGDQRFVPDEILVSFPANAPPQAIVGFAQTQRLALQGISRLPLINTSLYRFRITDGRPVPSVVQSVGGNGLIEAVQPNYVYALQDGAPNPIPGPAGDPAQYVLDKLRVREAHGIATGAAVRIAVIDSGIDATHPELQGRVAATFDSLRNGPPTDPHGTAMASAMAARGRLLGVAPSAQLLSVRAFEGQGASRGTTARILEGMQWAVDSGARVVNMSFTGPADPRLHQMVAAARGRGVVLVAAAGNEGPRAPAAYPAAYNEVIAVTATDAADGLFERANRGAYVALAAPGVDVFVAQPNGGYMLTTGTSVAAAHVSGLVALLIERNAALTPDGVQAILTSSARDLGPAGRDELFGAGLVDAVNALDTLMPKVAEQPPALSYVRQQQ